MNRIYKVTSQCIILFLLIVGTFFISGCSCKSKPEVMILVSEYTLASNEKMTIDGSVVRVSDDREFYLEVEDSAILGVVGNNIVPKTAGETKVHIMFDGFKESFGTVAITITSDVVARSVHFSLDEVNINMGLGNTDISRIVVEDNVTEVPIVTYDTSIISYETRSGKITAMSPGETIIVVNYKNVSASCHVTVTNEIFPTYFSISDMTIYVKDVDRLNFIMHPSNANQYIFSTTSNLIEVDATGNFRALAQGDAEVVCEYFLSRGDRHLETINLHILPLPDDISFTICDSTGNIISRAFVWDTIRLDISIENYELLGSFTFSDNVNVIENITYSDGRYYALVQPNTTGDIAISITCDRTFDDHSRELKAIQGLNVYSLEDIDTLVRVLVYPLAKNSQGDYVFLLHDDSINCDTIDFSFMLGGEFIYNDLEVYKLDGETETYVSSFTPKSTGEYSFITKYKGNIIERFKIIVE